MTNFIKTASAVALVAALGSNFALADHHEEKMDDKASMDKMEKSDGMMHENPMVGGAEMFADKNIVENAVNSADHTTLVAAVQAAGLVETLSGEGPFTVFAPTNDAFAALPEGTVENLLLPENKDTLTKILTCHVVAASAMSDAVKGMIDDDGGMHPVPTVGGCTLNASYDDDTILITDEQGNVATVTIADVKQSNGVIHVIDKVLLPAAE